MGKSKKIAILVVALIVIVAVAYVLTSKSNNNQVDTNSDVNNQGSASINVNNDNLDEIDVQSAPVISVPDDYDWRDSKGDTEFTVEYMTDEEKVKMNIAPETMVQVLDRDNTTGVVLAYKIITSESDVVTDTQN